MAETVNKSPYKKAPIVEAIFDIEITPEKDVSIDGFVAIHEKIKTDFPSISTSFMLTGALQVGVEAKDLKTDTKSVPIGKTLSSADKKRHIQMRNNGYTFNMQAPYTDWNNFSSLAFKYFEIYKSIVSIKTINRIALRYINQINIPLPLKGDNLNLYMKYVPVVPEGLPKALHSYFNQIQVPYHDKDILLSITQTILQNQNNNPNELPFLLDIDVFKFKNIPVNADLRSYFDILREIKNTTFESCVTDETKTLFN